MLVCLRLRPSVALMNFPEGREGSMDLSFLYRFERFHHSFVSAFALVVIRCLIADRLIGSSLLRNFGNRFLWDDPWTAACLANSSAASFPTDPMCPATHVKAISNFVGFSSSRRSLLISSTLWSLVISCLILSIRYWAGCGPFPSRVLIVAWLSMLKLTRVRVPLIDRARWNPKIIPTSSPSNTVCLVSGPNLYRSAAVLIPLMNNTADAPTCSSYPDPSVYIIVPLLNIALSILMAVSFESAIELTKSGYTPGRSRVGLIFSTSVGLNFEAFARWWR